MKMTNGDKNVVSNIRQSHKELVEDYSDEHIAQTWRDFSQSNEYPDMDKFIEWLKTE